MEEQEQQDIQIEPTPLPEPPSHKKLVIGIVAVAVLAIAGIAGAFYVLQSKNKIVDDIQTPNVLNEEIVEETKKNVYKFNEEDCPKLVLTLEEYPNDILDLSMWQECEFKPLGIKFKYPVTLFDVNEYPKPKQGTTLDNTPFSYVIDVPPTLYVRDLGDRGDIISIVSDLTFQGAGDILIRKSQYQVWEDVENYYNNYGGPNGKYIIYDEWKAFFKPLESIDGNVIGFSAHVDKGEEWLVISGDVVDEKLVELFIDSIEALD